MILGAGISSIRASTGLAYWVSTTNMVNVFVCTLLITVLLVGHSLFVFTRFDSVCGISKLARQASEL